MKNITALIILTLCLSVSALYAGSVPDINEGQYEITTKMEIARYSLLPCPRKNTPSALQKKTLSRKKQKRPKTV